MGYSMREAEVGDLEQVTGVFNHYVKSSFAAYPEDELDADYFFKLREITGVGSFYVIEEKGEVVGFGFMRPYHPFEVFSRTKELTYFILPEHTGKGLGARLLNTLIENARAQGAKTLLANISSKNQRSIEFHKKQGFRECGRLEKVGRKFGQHFDVVYMQRFV